MSESTDIDGDLYRTVLGRYPTGVVLVSAMVDDAPIAMVIGSFVSVSMDPPLVGFLPGKTSSTWAQMSGIDAFCVNVLADDQLEMCNSMFRKDIDPWSALSWEPAATGSPRITDALASIDCRVHDTVDAGDHWFVMGRVVELAAQDSGAPLVFLGGAYGSFVGFD